MNEAPAVQKKNIMVAALQQSLQGTWLVAAVDY
jgi:hypothetical protein